MKFRSIHQCISVGRKNQLTVFLRISGARYVGTHAGSCWTNRVGVTLLRITVKEGRLSIRRRSRAPTLRRALERSHREVLNMQCRRLLS